MQRMIEGSQSYSHPAGPPPRHIVAVQSEYYDAELRKYWRRDALEA